MAAGPRDYSQGTRAALAALSRGRCYEPTCTRPIIAFIGDEAFADFQIAHIFDAKPGNRYRSDMTDDERRAFSNLVLLCKPHHELVDKRHPERYSAELLLAWKTERERDFGIAGDELSSINVDELDELVAAAAVSVVADGPIVLGGSGGSAPGAGGGGGGAIGVDARGGDGGDGGDRYVLDGQPGASPGAGGGGGGAVGPGATGGPGGEGGEFVSGLVQLTEDIVAARVSVGRPGIGGVDGPGGDGEDTVMQLLNSDDEVVREIRAPGGRAPRSEGDPVDAELGPLIVCNYAEVSNGLLTAVGAGWEHYVLGPESVLAGWLVVTATSRVGGEARANVRFVGPSADTEAELVLPFHFAPGTTHLKRMHARVPFAFNVEHVGPWRIDAWTRSSSVELEFMVKLPDP